MEQGPKEKDVAPAEYRVLWHPETKKDLSRISPSEAGAMIEAAGYRLSVAPRLIGQPLKGTTHLLWKIRFSKYRIVYTLNPKAKEVWVLSIQGRDEVYRHSHIQSLLRLAVTLHEKLEKSR